MKRFFLFAIILFLSIGASNAFGASILVSQTVGVDGYGGSAWNNMTSALDSATGNNVSVVSNFEDLNLMLTYDALWLDLRGRGINDPPDLLSAVEVANLTSFINTGKRVVMIGEWGNIENPPHFVEDWNIQILSIVGGTFVGTPDEALTAIMYPEISHDLTNGVSQIDLTGNAIGVADGGTSLFNYNFATLWGNNVLTILDNGIFGDTFWSDADNSFFATNVANWVASPNEQAPYVFEQGLNGYFGVIDTSIVDGPTGVGSWGTFYPNAPADDAPLLLSGINRQTLIQFQGIFGALPGQIPYGSTIDSATLEFGSRNGSAQTHELYMMISSWEGSITWNSAGSGIQMDGIEASSSVVDSIIPVQDGGSFDVTSSVSDWSSGTPNNGWILTGTTPDDWTMFSSESLTAPGTDPLDQGPIPRLTITVADPADSDSDGIPDDQDACPSSDLSETVIIDSWDTGVDNVLLADGCTISDLIAECADEADNHGEFVSAVSHTTNTLKKEGVISGKDKGRIQKGAAKAAIP